MISECAYRDIPAKKAVNTSQSVHTNRKDSSMKQGVIDGTTQRGISIHRNAVLA